MRKDPYEALKAMIVRNQIPAGVRLTENDVAQQMGVSRTPAREALRRLRRDGLVVETGAVRTQFTVAPLTRDDLQETYEVMAALEGIAARRIARQPAAERRALAERMLELELALEHAATEEPQSFDRLFELHAAFHRELVPAGAGPRLRDLLAAVSPQADRYEWMYAPVVGPDHSRTFAEHRVIVEAVSAGTDDEIQDAVRANWMNGAARLLVSLDRWGRRGLWPAWPGGDDVAARTEEETNRESDGP